MVQRQTDKGQHRRIPLRGCGVKWGVLVGTEGGGVKESGVRVHKVKEGR